MALGSIRANGMTSICKQRLRCFPALILSCLLPGLGVFGSGKYLRGVTWFVVLFVLDIASYLCLRISVYALDLCLLVNITLWFRMMTDSWRPLENTTARRYCLLLLPGLAWTFLAGHIFGRPIKVGLLLDRSCCMEPTLTRNKCPLLNDVFVWSATSYCTAAPQRGDIVTIVTNGLRMELRRNKYVVKRIAGLPGETIRIDPPWLIVNGRPLIEPCIFRLIAERSNTYRGFATPGPQSLWCRHTYDELRIGTNEYFVIGDNSRESYDSRYYGAVHRSNILGKVQGIIWPPHRIRDL